MEVFVCKIPLENTLEDFITIYSQWYRYKFSVKVIHKKTAWEKNLSSDSVKSLSGFTQCGLEEYITETKKALTTQGGAKDFTYSLSDSELIWKKIVDKDKNIRVKFGSQRLEMASISCVAETIIDFLLNEGNEKRGKNIVLENENAHLRTVNSNLRTQVDEIVNFKTVMEETLHKKFIYLLNAKKEKILELERIINEQKGAASGTNVIMNRDITKTSEESSPLEKVSDPYGSETEIDSDEEKRFAHVPDKPVGEDSDSETGLDTDEEKYQPSTSKIQKLGSPVLPPREYKVIDTSDDSNSQLDFKNECNDSFDRDISVPIRVKKSQKTKFNKSTYKQNDGASTCVSPSKKQNVLFTSGSAKNSEDQKTKQDETKRNTLKEQSNDDFNLDDLLSEM